MFLCKDCGEEFKEHGYFKPCDAIDIDFENEPICPKCGSLNIEELMLCEYCSQGYTEGSLCKECADMADDIMQYAYSKHGLDKQQLYDLVYFAVN